MVPSGSRRSGAETPSYRPAGSSRQLSASTSRQASRTSSCENPTLRPRHSAHSPSNRRGASSSGWASPTRRSSSTCSAVSIRVPLRRSRRTSTGWRGSSTAPRSQRPRPPPCSPLLALDSSALPPGVRSARTRYLVPPEHTARARETLGPEPWLCVEQKVLLEREPSKARRVARQACAFYLGLSHYQQSMRRLGFGEADLADGGSDRLIDALVAWGDAEALARRVRAHRDAGATHVCLQPIDPEGSPRPDPRALEALAPSGGIAA